MLRDRKAGAISDDEAIQRLERSPHWVWTAMDPDSKVLLGIEVGTRTLAMAQRVVHHVVQTLVPSCVPLCLTDGYRDYTTAILSHFGFWHQPSRQRAGIRGRVGVGSGGRTPVHRAAQVGARP